MLDECEYDYADIDLDGAASSAALALVIHKPAAGRSQRHWALARQWRAC